MTVDLVPTEIAFASYGHEKTVVMELAYRVFPSALIVIPWFKLFNATKVLVDATQPSADIVCAVMPFPDWTISMLPAESHMRLRGLVRPPRTLVAFHPLARTDWKTAAPAPEQDAGIEAALAGVVAFAVETTLVDNVVAALLVVGAAVVEAIGVTDNTLLDTQALKLGLLAAFKS